MTTTTKFEKTLADFTLYLSQRTPPISVILKYLYPGINRSNLIFEMKNKGWTHVNSGEFDIFDKDKKEFNAYISNHKKEIKFTVVQIFSPQS